MNREEVGATDRRWILIIVCTASLLVCSQLPFAGFLADDYLHRAIIDVGLPSSASKWDLYRFFTGNPRDLGPGLERGFIPWFVYPEIKLAFFRPLGGALTVFDSALFGDWAPGYLLHTGFWYIALCGSVAYFYQRVLPGRAARIAGLIFCIAAVHHQAVIWFSARSGVVAAVFGVIGLMAHLRFRSDRFRWGSPLSVVAFVIALSAGEAALGCVALLVTYEVFGASGSAQERVRALLPVLTITAAYMALYLALGYGTHGSGAYINPLDEPLGYLAELPQRLLASMGTLLFAVPGDQWFFLPEQRNLLAAIGALALLVFGVWAHSARRSLHPRSYPIARWMLAGTLAALLPQMAGLLGPRSYLIPSIASYAVVGLLLSDVSRPTLGWVFRLLKWTGAGVVVILHGVLGPVLWVAGGKFYADVARATRLRHEAMQLSDAGLAVDDVILVSVPDVFVGIYLPLERVSKRQTLPRTWRLLSLAECDHHVKRSAERVLEVELVGCAMSETQFEQLYRRDSNRLRVADVVTLPGFRAEVLAVNAAGFPNHFGFTFERSFDDPHVRVFSWHDGRMRRIHLAVGESRVERWVRPF